MPVERELLILVGKGFPLKPCFITFRLNSVTIGQPSTTL
jgi:hypothetical protein